MNRRLRLLMFLALLVITLTTLTAPVYAVPFLEAVAWSPDGTKLAVTYGINCMQDTNYIAIIEAATGMELSRHYSENCYYTSLDWSPDGTKLAVASYESPIRIYNVNTWSLELTMESPAFVRSHQYNLRWSPDGTLLANQLADSRIIELWNAITGEDLPNYGGHRGLITSFAWSPDSQRIASTSDDNTVQVWDPLTLDLLLSIDSFDNDMTGVDWRPDGQRFATVGLDRNLRIWDANTGALLNTVTGLEEGPGPLAWRPFSEQIGVIIWSDDTIEIWDSISGNLVDTISSEARQPYELRWSPDGTQLAYVVVPRQFTADLPYAVETVTSFGLTPTPPQPTPET